MTFKYKNPPWNTTIAPIAGGTGITSFTVTSAAAAPTLAAGQTTTARIADGTGSAENIWITAISGTTVTCSATTIAHANGDAFAGGVLSEAALDQIKLDANIPGNSGNNGASALGSPFTLSGATGVYQDTGLSIALPAAGKYLVFARARASVGISSSFCEITAKLYNSTLAADASGAADIFYTDLTGHTISQPGFFMALVTVAAANTIKLYAARTFGGTVTSSTIEGAGTAETTLTWFKLND